MEITKMAKATLRSWLWALKPMTLQLCRKGLEKCIPIYPNLKVLSFNEIVLEEMSANDLEQFPKLQLLSLHETHVVRLIDDLFKYTPDLKWLRVTKNPLHGISSGILNALQLYGDFSKNNCFSILAKDQSGIQELKQKLAGNCTIRV